MDEMSTEQDVAKTSKLYRALSWLVAVLVPVALVLAAVRAMMTPAFLHFEYNLPGFPEDPFGFTKEDRLYWAQFAVDYLVNSAGIEYLADLRFENGAPFYNERELSHMLDVKNTTRIALSVWYLSLAALVVLGVWAWRAGWLAEYRRGLSRGGFLTVILLGAVVLFVLLSFRVIFVAFHQVFFQAGTWMFEFSDSLIRMFPEQFWRDIFLYVGGLSLVAGLALGIGLRQRTPKN
jgi:integral membrane protein (TIGR01906 family)